MSAESDPRKRNIRLIHSNEESDLKKKPQNKTQNKPVANSRVLKASDLKYQTSGTSIRVNPYIPTPLLTQNLSRPTSLPSKTSHSSAQTTSSSRTDQSLSQNSSLENLKQNLKTLHDLHLRMRFMLTELEDLIRD